MYDGTMYPINDKKHIVDDWIPNADCIRNLEPVMGGLVLIAQLFFIRKEIFAKHWDVTVVLLLVVGREPHHPIH